MSVFNEKKELILDILIIILGNFFIALGVNLFILPCDVLSGGVSGIAVALQPIFHLPPTLVINALTIGLFLVGVVALGKGFLLKTIISTIVYPLFISLLNNLLNGYQVTDNQMLASLYAGVCVGAGLGLVMRCNASTGGMDIPPLVIHKFTGLPLSTLVMCTDGAVVVLGALTYGLEASMIGLLSVFVTGKVIDVILTMGSQGMKQVMIISDHHEEILSEIYANMKRGATLLQGKGGYRRGTKEVIMIVVYKKQYPGVDRIVKHIDPEAFVIVSDVNEVHGEGFTYEQYM